VRLCCQFVPKRGYDSGWNGAHRKYRQVHLFSDPVGRSFAAQIDQNVTLKGTVLLKAATKVFGKIHSSRANPRKSEPLSLELTSISVNGRNVPIKTNSVQPGIPTVTARQARYGHTAGTLTVTPGTKMQFQLQQAATF